LSAYFFDKMFSDYFLNIIGFMQFKLPGVFENNTFKGTVNGSLWTIPFEIGCYLMMSLAIIFGLVKSKKRMLIGAAIFIGIFFGLYYYCPPLQEGTAISEYLMNFVAKRSTLGTNLYFYFMTGALLYSLGDSVPYSKCLAALSVVAIWVDSLLPQG